MPPNDLSHSELIRALRTMISGYRTTQMISVIAKLGIADLLKDGPKDVEELAQATNTHSSSLYRLLRAVASLGIFAEDDQRRFRLTPLAEPLQRDVPGSLHAGAIFAGEFWRWQAWGHLLQSIQTGETAFNHTYGMGWFEYLAQHSEASAVFDAAMASSERHRAVTAAYDFSTIRTLVDVGGGTGRLLVTILQANPHLLGVLCDTPQVTARAPELLKAAGVADRCEIVAGDFFAGLPSGGDAYLLSLIVHDWEDEQAIMLLENCHRAMNARGKLLLVEQVVPTGNAPALSKLLDITMLVEAGGRERTETEFHALFASAGFKLTKILPTRAPECVLEGIRVEKAR
jgi:O-methyltransferase domain/Dimerisation domain